MLMIEIESHANQRCSLCALIQADIDKKKNFIHRTYYKISAKMCFNWWLYTEIS